MIELGKKDEIFGAELLQLLQLYGRPSSLPHLSGEEKVICGYDQGLGERIIVCESLEDMQKLYDAYATGGALRIHWYKASDPGFVRVIVPENQT